MISFEISPCLLLRGRRQCLSDAVAALLLLLCARGAREPSLRRRCACPCRLVSRVCSRLLLQGWGSASTVRVLAAAVRRSLLPACLPRAQRTGGASCAPLRPGWLSAQRSGSEAVTGHLLAGRRAVLHCSYEPLFSQFRSRSERIFCYRKELRRAASAEPPCRGRPRRARHAGGDLKGARSDSDESAGGRGDRVGDGVVHQDGVGRLGA